MKNIKYIYLYSLFCAFIFSNNHIASVYFVEGDCYVENDRTGGYSMGVLTGQNIFNNDIIKTNDKSHCFVRLLDDKTHIHIGPNSIVQIDISLISQEINLLKGSVYVKNLYKENIKTYIFTNYNQIYLNNHRFWISHFPNEKDMMFSLDNSINVYNNLLKKKIVVPMQNLINVSNSISFIKDIQGIIPDYIVSDIGTFDYNMKKIELKNFDMIPIYGKRISSKEIIDPWSLSFSSGPYFINNDTHFKIGLYPQYKYKNLLFNFKLESYANPSGENFRNDWDDFIDMLGKISVEYSFSDKVKKINLKYGSLDNVTFGAGYMINNFSNSLDYPRQRDAGFLLDYVFDVDFVDLKIIIPSIRDFNESGGIIGARSSLFISHNFPLTLGVGFITDLNQSSFLSHYLEKKGKSRSIYGLEFDYNYSLISNIDLELDMFGEIVSLWYPEYNYYVVRDDADVSDDLKWRKGVWGINAPGISLKFDNRYLFKFSLNFNSATFIPNYFNSTYLYNRSRYYKADLDFPLVQKQIDYLNDNFLIGCDSEADDAECEYMIPKDVYPILFENNGFSPYATYGFTTEFAYNIQTYINTSFATSVFVENSNESDVYCSIQTALNIDDGFIRNVKYLKFYYSNLFFEKLSDKYRMNFGMETEIYLPSRLSLIINLGQVYYDSKNDIIDDNNIDKMINSMINLKYEF